MAKRLKLIVSHAPFWHDGGSISKMNLNMILALLPAAIFGIVRFGMPALGVVALSVSSAMLFELLFNLASKRPITTGDFDAALIGLLFALMVPAPTPWWVVVCGTFLAVVIGKQIYGGIGGNPFYPVVLSLAILMVSWPVFFDADAALVNYRFDFKALAPLPALKHQGTSALYYFNAGDLLMGDQIGSIGTIFPLGILIGGIYLIIRGYIKWEVTVSFVAGLVATAWIFNVADPDSFAGPMVHLFSGYTMLAAFFLVTENSSSPVNLVPMLIYGALGGFLVILIRNIGVYPDGTIFAILLINLVNPLIDTIRPKALGRRVNNA